MCSFGEHLGPRFNFDTFTIFTDNKYFNTFHMFIITEYCNMCSKDCGRRCQRLLKRKARKRRGESFIYLFSIQNNWTQHGQSQKQGVPLKSFLLEANIAGFMEAFVVVFHSLLYSICKIKLAMQRIADQFQVAESLLARKSPLLCLTYTHMCRGGPSTRQI